MNSDLNKKLITLTVISLSRFYSIFKSQFLNVELNFKFFFLQFPKEVLFFDRNQIVVNIQRDKTKDQLHQVEDEAQKKMSFVVWKKVTEIFLFFFCEKSICFLSKWRWIVKRRLWQWINGRRRWLGEALLLQHQGKNLPVRYCTYMTSVFSSLFVLSSCSQFHQHFTSSFCASILVAKKHKAKL